ncbi:MAG: hypothetical protein SVS85_03280, partial [Candidatus Nanohaloarchaea archaeon]|nr:hypothetical protein [Candidatus Nanohaloarchaea archaeon]
YREIRGTAVDRYNAVTETKDLLESCGEEPGEYLRPKFNTHFVELVAEEEGEELPAYLTSGASRNRPASLL